MMLRALAVIALVLLILLLAIPLGVGMAMTAGCPECRAQGALCLAVLATLMIVVLGFREGAHATRSSSPAPLLARSLERPPQLASV